MNTMPLIELCNGRGANRAANVGATDGTVRLIVLCTAALLLNACSSNRPAPVIDSRSPTSSTPIRESKTIVEPPRPVESVSVHTVQRGETLISIALQNGLDYRELAAWNNIENPNLIRVGDTLRLSAPSAATTSSNEPVATPLRGAGAPLAQPSAPETHPPVNTALLKVEPRAGKIPYSEQTYAKLVSEASSNAAGAAVSAASVAVVPVNVPVAGGAADSVDWAWPAKGKVSAQFTDLSKGIDIAGERGTPVLAAAAGKVIYNQSGLRGYGKLVIIKHSETWLSAYGHNDKVLVSEGQEVKKGQKIAEMGSSDTESVKLHFEIRSKGKPVDPVKLLPPQ